MKRINHKEPTKPTLEEMLEKLRQLDEDQLKNATGGLQPPDRCAARPCCSYQ